MGQSRHFSTDGFIIKTSVSGEIHRNFTFISPELGVKQATAFGASKIKSRFCSGVQPFVKAKLFLYQSPKTSYYKLEDLSDITLNDFISKDIRLLYLTYFCCDIILKAYFSQEEYKSYYYLLLYTIDILKEYKDPVKAFIFFTSKFLFLSGYTFNLNHCKKCNSTFDSYYFDTGIGGLLCDIHAFSKRHPISAETARLWNAFFYQKYVTLKTVDIKQKSFSQIYPITLKLITKIFEKELTTAKTLNMVFTQ